MGLVAWILVGLVAGFIAEFALGGGSISLGPMRLLRTGVLGVVGAIVGGFVSTRLGYGDVTGFNVRSVVIAAVGAVLVILAVRVLTGGSRRGVI